MILLALNLLLIVFWNAAFKPTRSIQGKKVFCFLCGLQWVILSGFRSDNIGDTGRYHTLFTLADQVSFSDYLESIIPQLLFQDPMIDEPMFYLCAKAVQYFGGNYRVYLLLLAVLVSFSLAYYIYDNAENPFWGFFLFSCVFYPFLFMSAERQSVAIALAGLLGFCCVKRKQYVRFIILVLVSILFHRSAILCIPMLLIHKLPFSRGTLVAFSIVLAFLLIFHTPILNVTAPLLGYGYYLEDTYVGSRSLLYLVSYLAIWIMAAWRRPLCVKQDKNFDLFFWMLAIGVLFSAFAFDNSNAFRISFYYTFTMFFLVPDIIESFRPKTALLLKYLFSIACIGAFCFLTTSIMNVDLFASVGYIFSFKF